MTALMLNEVERLLLKAEVEQSGNITMPVETLRAMLKAANDLEILQIDYADLEMERDELLDELNALRDDEDDDED